MSRQTPSLLGIKRRATARLGRHMEKNLLAYVAAGSAGLLSALPADAEIVYTPCNTPIAIAHQNQGPAVTALDLTNTGNPQFGFVMSSTAKFSYSGTTTRFKFFLKIRPNQNGNEAVQGQQAPTASAVPAGVKIGPQEKFAPGDLYMAVHSFNGVSRNSGTWQNVEYAYVGLKFLINGQVHYGWARIKFPYPGGIGYPGGDYYPSIYGYAYESTPNQPIAAGQTSGTSQNSTSGSPQSTTSAAPPASLGMLAGGSSALNLWRAPMANPLLSNNAPQRKQEE
jgi:hypothetical protein